MPSSLILNSLLINFLLKHKTLLSTTISEYNYAMNSNKPLAHIHPITTYQNGGTYVLQMTLTTPITLAFGRFQKSTQYSLDPAQYIYIGSALTQANRPALLQRTARHASRTDPDYPHSARAHLLDYAQTLSIPPNKILLKQNKKLHWHIDHFVDHHHVNITDIFLIPHTKTYESILATQLESHPQINAPIPGLGASDTTRETHFLKLNSQLETTQLKMLITQIVNSK